jgi:hypothetical protein
MLGFHHGLVLKKLMSSSLFSGESSTAVTSWFFSSQKVRGVLIGVVFSLGKVLMTADSGD